MMVYEFLKDNAFHFILTGSAILTGWGYYRAKFDDLLEAKRQTDEEMKKMAAILAKLETFKAVQETENRGVGEKLDGIVQWLKSIDSKFDRLQDRLGQ